MAAKPRKNAAKKATKKTTKRTTKKTAARRTVAAKKPTKRTYNRKPKADAVLDARVPEDVNVTTSGASAIGTEAPTPVPAEEAPPVELRQVEVLDIRHLSSVERAILANYLTHQGYLTPKLNKPADAEPLVQLIQAPDNSVFTFNHDNKICDLVSWDDHNTSRAISRVMFGLNITVGIEQPKSFYADHLSPAEGVLYIRLQ